MASFLGERDADAAARMQGVLEQALVSIAEFPERTPLVNEGRRLRELRVRFGRYGYAIQYRVDEEAVLVAHIFHVREAR